MTKARLLLFFFGLLYLIIIGKLFYFQIINPFNPALTNYLNTKKIFPERGKIYDQNGDPLVVNKTVYLLYAEPKKIADKKLLIEKIAPLLQLNEATLQARLDNDKSWVAIKADIEKEEKDAIIKLGLRGLGFEDGSKRYYPEGSLAAHLLGFVGKDEKGDNIGYFGIEGFYEKDLAGLPGIIKSDRDILGRPILIGTQQKLEPENGRNLYLTIDKSIQEIAKKKLAVGLTTYKAKQGCIIVSNPQTGEVLALTCLPDFDADHYFQFSEDFFRNPAISDLYEPGSIFKPLIMAAAIEEKKISPNDFYDETNPISLSGYTIKTWNNKYEGKISMTRILEKSSNVGMVFIGQKLGSEKIYQYLQKYGFGQFTGIDLQGEVSGTLRPKESLHPIDFATITFGQGIATTPIQMVTAFASIINGGKLLKPYVVKKIADENEEKKIQPKVVRRIIGERTSKIIRKMLKSTVDNGEVKWAKPKGYSIGGKTGTAQIPIQGHYDPYKTVASFIGFAPVDQPKFLILVTLKEPQTSPWGSETAAPLFFEIAKELFVLYNIAPE